MVFLLPATAIAADHTGAGHANSGTTIALAITLNEKNCQLAVWLTDDQGRFVDTLFVTRKTGRKGLGNRGGGLDDKWGGSRLSVLPVWAHQRGRDYGGGNYYPPADQPLPDAVSGATPKAGVFNLQWTSAKPLNTGIYHYYIEVNKSFDDNEQHDYSWYRGQPSVVWRGELTVGPESCQSQARIIGHGEAAGADGVIDPDLSTLTTALKLIEKAEASYLP